MTFLAVYAPNDRGENADFWYRLKEALTDPRNNYPEPDVLLGDFNVTELDIDRVPAKWDDANAANALLQLRTHLQMEDGWRKENPTRLTYSWSRQTRNETGSAQRISLSRSRIDRIYIRKEMLRSSCEWGYDTHPILSDHNLASMVYFDVESPYIGKGRWSIPTFLVENGPFMKTLAKESKSAMREAENHAGEKRSAQANPQTALRKLKERIMSLAKEKAKRIPTQIQIKLQKLKDENERLLNDSSVGERTRAEESTKLEAEMKDLEREKLHRDRISATTKHALEDETLGKYWINLSKERAKRDTVYGLKDPTDHSKPLIYKSKDMAEAARTYHESLQREGACFNITEQEREQHIRAALDSLGTRVNEEHRAEMSSAVEHEEVRAALRGSPNGKAPGMDGIPAEVWKGLDDLFLEQEKNPEATNSYGDVVKILQLAFNDIEEHGVSEGTDFTLGWMCPIYKKKDKSDIANYRPITVLNTDYKIFTKTLSTRLAKAAQYLIHPNQAGFMTGRRIDDQTELIKLMIRMCELEDLDGYLVFLDQEKAYDKVTHEFLQRTMERLDLPERFRSTVRSLYENAYTSVIINGEQSSQFKVTRGVRQGDPLSCLLFNLVIESLASMLRNSSLKGFNLAEGRERLITTLFADDTTVYLSKEDNFQDLEAILESWSLASGAKFNVEKTEVVPVGSQTFRDDLRESRQSNGSERSRIPGTIRIAHDEEPVRALGAFVGNRIDDIAVWEPTIEALEKRLERWTHMNPTLEGRRLVASMEIGGRTQYRAMVQGMPEAVEKQVEKITRDFIWNGKPSAVNKTIMRDLPTNGGKKVLDIKIRNEAIDIMRLKRYLTFGDTRPLWALVADKIMAHDVPKYHKLPDTEAGINPFLQKWRPPKQGRRNKLPSSTKRMLRVAEKYGLRFLPPNPDENLKREMPAWSHLNANPARKINESARAPSCLVRKHRATTVGNLVEIVGDHSQDHDDAEEDEDSPCADCEEMEDVECKDPRSCLATAKRKLGLLDPIWDPEEARTPEYTEIPGLDGEAGEAPFLPQTEGYNSLTDAFRIFVEKEYTNPRCPLRLGDPQQEGGGTTDVYVDAISARAQDGNTVGSIGIVTKGRRDLEVSQRVTKDSPQDTRSAMIVAVMEAMERIPQGSRTRIHTQSGLLIESLTEKLGEHEDKGWRLHPEGKLLAALVSTLRRRDSFTTFVTTNKSKMRAEEKRASKLAKMAVRGDTREGSTMITPKEDTYIPGAKLQSLTQSEIYKLILQVRSKEVLERKDTKENMKRTLQVIAKRTKKSPTASQWWDSLRTKDIHSRRTKAFLWKLMHEALPVGKLWEKIRGHEDKARCHLCSKLETAEHILKECRGNGQRYVWEEVRKILTKKGIGRAPKNKHDVLASTMMRFRDADGEVNDGKARLYKKIVSESAYLIWTMRCTWKIEHGGTAEAAVSKQEAVNRWNKHIDKVMTTDILATNKAKYKEKASDPKKVQETWSGLVDDEERLQENTVGQRRSGGLVGRVR